MSDQHEWDFPPPCAGVHLERKHLPDERAGVTWTLVIGDERGVRLGKKSLHAGAEFIKAVVTTGEYDDGRLGELFVATDQEGSFVRGVLDGFAVLLSIALQYGIPLEKLVEKFQHVRFEPSGMTNDHSVPMATSFFDFLFKKLALQYLDEEQLEILGITDRDMREEENGREKRLTKGISGAPLNEKKDHESPIPKDLEGDEGKETL
jgi:hypothetical protein